MKISRKITFRGISFLLGFTIAIAFGCAGEKAFDGGQSLSSLSDYSGYIVVASVTTEGADGPSAGPGQVTLFDASGNFVRKLRDYTQSSEMPTGLAYDGNGNIYIAVDGSDRIEVHNLLTGVTSTFGPVAGLSGNPIRDLVRRSSDGSLFVSEWTTSQNIEMYSSVGTRIGAPYITSSTAGTATCNLSGPYGMAYIPTVDKLAIISHPAGSTAGRLSVIDVSTATPACDYHVTAAPFNANTPMAIAYHAPTNKLLVTFSSGNTVSACNVDGTGCTTIINAPTIVVTPRSITTDSRGYIYVGSTGTETIERYTWTGSGSATRDPAGGPLIGPRIETVNASSILVIE